MVFGKSRIVGDPRDAIDDAFITLEAIKNDTSREIRLVESTAFDKEFAPEVAEQLKNIIIPSKGQTIAHDTAFGVFLGYSLGIEKNRPSAEFRELVAKKMRKDIQAHVSYIIEKIKTAGMEFYSFYFYFLPFNEADEDKQEIMKSLLGFKGGVQSGE